MTTANLDAIFRLHIEAHGYAAIDWVGGRASIPKPVAQAIAALQASLATAERERDESRRVLSATEVERSSLRDGYMIRGEELGRICKQRERLAEQVGADDIGWDLVAEAVDRLKARAEAAERRLAEPTKPGPATERPACWAVVDGDAFKSVWTDESIARTMGEAVPLYRGWGRAELAARVADLESQLADARAEASKWYKAAADGIDAMGEHGRKEADALRARVAELKAEVEQVITDIDGPIVVPASAFEGDDEPTPALVDLMRRPAQTCPQCDAPEIHCAGCGTNASRAWECAECAAGGDAGREGDRLRDAVTDRSLAIRGLLGALTVAGMVVDASMANAVAPLYDATKALNAHLAAQPPAPLRDSWEARGGQHYAQAPAQVAQPAPFDFAAYVANQERWSTATFGPGPRHAGIIDHIRKELAEIAADPADIAEWVDVIILAIDGAWRCGGATGETLAAALAAKAAKNRARTWPDWRTAPPDKAIEHDRSGEPPPVEPAKGERFVVVPAGEVNGRPAFAVELSGVEDIVADFTRNPGEFEDDFAEFHEQAPTLWTHAVIDTAPAPRIVADVTAPAPVATSDVARLAAALQAVDYCTPSEAVRDAEAILRHLAGPLPGVDQAEALAIAYWKAAGVSAPMVGTADGFVDCLRRALASLGATEPARVTVGEIVEAAYSPATGTREKYEATVRGFIGRTVAP